MLRKTKPKAQATPRKRSPRKRRLGQRGGLVLIASLLLGSALLRVGNNAGQAFALANEKVAMSELEPAPTALQCDTPDDLRPMLEAFQKREERLALREEALRDRMHALTLADEKVSEKLAALRTAETALRETIALAESAAEDDLDRLTKVYETMKPKQAAALFEEMAPEFAAGFLGRMRPDAAAAILAGLSPEAAHTFSVVLAGRNANVPAE